MTVELNHTIVAAQDQERGAAFLTDVLGLEPPSRFGPFTVVALAHGMSLDYLTEPDPAPQHYAFLVSDEEYGRIVERLRARDVTTYANPQRRQVGENTHDGGHGAYFTSPEGHILEILTRPYGSGSSGRSSP